ncbi:MAG: tRNA (adenosine(37)-N6)-threonylcarbamoyltransferase complex dimerization subunit type 1 TsaB [Candidatus Limnocylindria bacterium]
MILALESSATDQSVALADREGALLGRAAWTAAGGQGGELLPRLLELLDRQRATLRDVSAVAVGIGPGSFTGLRVGLALAKGLASGLGCPIIGIPSLDAWLAAVPDAHAALTRAGAAEVYAQARDAADPQIVPFSALSAALRERPVVAPRDLAVTLDLTRAQPPDEAADAVARLAAKRMASGSTDDLARLEPAYLRPPRGLGDSAPAPITWL